MIYQRQPPASTGSMTVPNLRCPSWYDRGEKRSHVFLLLSLCVSSLIKQNLFCHIFIISSPKPHNINFTFQKAAGASKMFQNQKKIHYLMIFSSCHSANWLIAVATGEGDHAASPKALLLAILIAFFSSSLCPSALMKPEFVSVTSAQSPL